MDVDTGLKVECSTHACMKEAASCAFADAAYKNHTQTPVDDLISRSSNAPAGLIILGYACGFGGSM
jgi:hypothetical protein